MQFLPKWNLWRCFLKEFHFLNDFPQILQQTMKLGSFWWWSLRCFNNTEWLEHWKSQQAQIRISASFESPRETEWWAIFNVCCRHFPNYSPSTASSQFGNCACAWALKLQLCWLELCDWKRQLLFFLKMDSLTVEEVTEMLQAASFPEDLVASLASKLSGMSN